MTAKYAYKTKEYSPETGLVFFGARYYNPLIGRFITKDPSGMVDGPNVYIYCNNDPVNRNDPWGLEDERGILNIMKGIVKFFDNWGKEIDRTFGERDWTDDLADFGEGLLDESIKQQDKEGKPHPVEDIEKGIVNSFKNPPGKQDFSNDLTAFGKGLLNEALKQQNDLIIKHNPTRYYNCSGNY